MHAFLGVLKQHGLIGRKGPKVSTIRSLSLTKIADIAVELDHAITFSRQREQNSIFCHSASLGLGGDSSECMNLDCRISRINRLARFALMYSDKVYISSFFSAYKDIDDSDNTEFIQRQFYEDLLVIDQVRPLLEHGYIDVFPPNMDTCFSCQAREFLGDAAGKRFPVEYDKLQREYLDRMSVEVEKDGDTYLFTCDGPFPYFDHESISALSSENVHPALMSKSRIMGSIEKGKIVQLSKSMIKELGLHINMAHDVATNAIHGLTTSACLKTSFLTEHDLHVSFLNSLNAATRTRENNRIASKYLSSIVPFAEDVALVDIMKLRKREEESFISYRQALNQAIDTFRSSGNDFTVHDAQALHADVIAPSLANLDRSVKEAKKDLISKPFRSLAGVVGVISFGMLTGLVPPDIAPLAKTIGLIKFAADVVKDTMAVGDKERVVRNDQFYFLWKLKKRMK
ncbi:MAG: hypothetical protein D4R93_04225 [Deltaproteobacteria bacterium]|nr:MAG: hypothetical protein D4R93_04225 [Deltaproteobacteria bacterium]